MKLKEIGDFLEKICYNRILVNLDLRPDLKSIVINHPDFSHFYPRNNFEGDTMSLIFFKCSESPSGQYHIGYISTQNI